MSSLPIHTLNDYSFVALRGEFYPLKFSHGPRYLPIDMGSSLSPGYERTEDLLLPLRRTGLLGEISLLRIPKRRVEV
jgi:hypothetical protein